MKVLTTLPRDNKREIISHRPFDIEGKSSICASQNHAESVSSSNVEDTFYFNEGLSSPARIKWMTTMRDDCTQ